jgi:hypothetical protein
MEWKSLMSKLDPMLSQAKEMGNKAIDFTQKKLQSTPLVIKNLTELDELRLSKRFILISYDALDPNASDILLHAPVWGVQAWSDAAELRLAEKATSSEIFRSLGIETPLDMRVWYTGQETFHTSDAKSIKEWWETRCYDGKKEEEKISPEPSSQDVEEKKEVTDSETTPSAKEKDPPLAT